MEELQLQLQLRLLACDGVNSNSDGVKELPSPPSCDRRHHLLLLLSPFLLAFSSPPLRVPSAFLFPSLFSGSLLRLRLL